MRNLLMILAVAVAAATASSVTAAATQHGPYGAIATPAGHRIPPRSAAPIANLDDMTSWRWCSSSLCSGHGGGLQATTFGVSAPSLDGGSLGFRTWGSAYADVLHYIRLAPNDVATRFLLDLHLSIDDVAPVQALEFDFIQGTGKQKFNFSLQCDNSFPRHPVWDTWDEASTRWMRTGIDCSDILNANAWHHVRLFGEMMHPGTPAARTRYVWIEVDGKRNPVPAALAVHAAVPSRWHALVVQIQEDLNARPGNGFSEYLDELNLYVWSPGATFK